MPNDIILDALFEAVQQLSPNESKRMRKSISWALLGDAITRMSLDAGKVLAEAALIAQRKTVNLALRDSMTYVIRKDRPLDQLRFSEKSSKPLFLEPTIVHEAVQNANHVIEKTHIVSEMNSVPIFALLGLRNLSSFVGEIFARELQSLMPDVLTSNPNQDGYPDLLAMTNEGKIYYLKAEKDETLSDKSLWSPYPYGGIEVKATCGSTPPAKQHRKLRLGEARIPSLRGLDWKSHHRNTNRLLGLYWDFVDGLPTVVGAFYRNDLSPNDWGKIVKPREGGGNTTSVSVMKRRGVKNMGAGWLVLPKTKDYLVILAKRSLLALQVDEILEN